MGVLFAGDRLLGAILLFRRVLSVHVVQLHRCSLARILDSIQLRTLGGHLRQSSGHGRGGSHLRMVFTFRS